MSSLFLKSVGLMSAAVLLLCTISAQASMTNLTTAGSSGTVNGAIFEQFDVKASGTGVFDSFLRIGDEKSATSGYNTDGIVEFDTKGDIHTHSIRLNEVPIVDIGGIKYREFLLDTNEPGAANKSDVSLDAVKIHLGTVGNLSGYPANFNPAIYDLDAGGDNWIKVNSSLSTGSGSSDIRMLVKNSLFTGSNSYIYLYCEFGSNENAESGFEEWGVRKGWVEPVPAPGAALLAAFGLGLVSRLKRRFA